MPRNRPSRPAKAQFSTNARAAPLPHWPSSDVRTHDHASCRRGRHRGRDPRPCFQIRASKAAIICIAQLAHGVRYRIFSPMGQHRWDVVLRGGREQHSQHTQFGHACMLGVQPHVDVGAEYSKNPYSTASGSAPSDLAEGRFLFRRLCTRAMAADVIRFWTLQRSFGGGVRV